jgi:transcriptional regulator NrdR family protein
VQCPTENCGEEMRVISTWHTSKGIARKRRCSSCGAAVSSLEKVRPSESLADAFRKENAYDASAAQQRRRPLTLT